jgi:branched-chain amino acid transport system substrate-binding protein
MLGRRIASYAIKNLHIRDFCIISPLSDYGRILSENFKKEVKKNRGQIIAEEFFDEGTKDFRQQFIDLRKKLMERVHEKRALEEGIDYEATQSRRRRRADSLYIADSVMEIGGLFLPAEAEDVVMLAPQVHFHRIQTQILGSTGWHSSTVLLDGKRYVNDAIISTSFETNMTDERWVNFSKAYKTRFSKEPDRLVAPLAYDAAKLLLNAVSTCEDDSKAISKMLLETAGYRGLSGTITFKGSEGANTETAIMKLKNKQFIRIQ